MKQRRSFFIRAAAAAVLATAASSAAGVGAGAADWPKYLHDIGGSGSTPDRGITALTAASLKPKAGWPVRLGDRPITTQPIVANGLIYVGAWDGYEYALHPDGTTAWRQYLGRTKNCFIADAVSTTTAGTVAGVVSTGAIATASIGGRSRSVLYVGGGGNRDSAGAAISGTADLIALDALTGDRLWRSPLGAAPNHLIWSSPTVSGGSSLPPPMSGAPVSASVSFPAKAGSTGLYEQDFNSRGFPAVAAGAINAIYVGSNNKSYAALTMNSVGGLRSWKWINNQWINVRAVNPSS